MSGTVNKALIVGNLGRDPEVRSLQNGGKVCNLTVATSERWKDRNSGEQKEATEWHRVVIFDEKLCDVAEKYLQKGAKVYLEGQIKTRRWKDANGADRYSTEIVLPKFGGVLTILTTQDRGDAHEPSDTTSGSYGGWADSDDEVPF